MNKLDRNKSILHLIEYYVKYLELLTKSVVMEFEVNPDSKYYNLPRTLLQEIFCIKSIYYKGRPHILITSIYI